MKEKYTKLIEHLKSMGSIVVAFSGGVDSTFLLKVSKEALGDKVKAVTIKTPYIPEWEIQESIELIRSMGIKHEIVEKGIIDSIKNNPTNRCYLCKTSIFTFIKEKAIAEGYNEVVDGTNFDDTKDYRPGLKALEEIGIRSPLLECEISKDEIREMSKELGLPTWNKPPYACLLTRLPHDTPVKISSLDQIEQGEVYLFFKGIKAVRVRKHDALARIEIAANERHKLYDQTLMDDINHYFKKIGFDFVTMDLGGYRMGSFNPVKGSE